MKAYVLLCLCVSLSLTSCQRSSEEPAPSSKASPTESGANSKLPNATERPQDVQGRRAEQPEEKSQTETRNTESAQTTKPIVQASTSTVQFIKVDGGIQLFRGKLIGQEDVILKIAPPRRIDIVIPESARVPGFTLEAYKEHYGAIALMSGGYMSSFDPPIPIGLVRVNGQTVNRPAYDELMTGTLCIQHGRAAIRPFNKDSIALECDGALQAGPLMILDGKSVISDTARPAIVQFSAAKYARGFIALDRDRRVILGFVGPVSLYDLVKILLRPLREGGFDCIEALYLPHGGGGGLLLDSEKEKIRFGATYSNYPNAIAVR